MDTELLVIGAGPYALATAAFAQEQGIKTTIVGRPMGFWKQQMPTGMFLRSGPDWHLDPSGVDTLEAYLEHAGIGPQEIDPIPIKVFLDYAEWFQRRKRLKVCEDFVVKLDKPDGRFGATLENGEHIRADAVVAAPGIRHYVHLPEWAASVPADRFAHTCELVDFRRLAGARVLIVGGRQSAYEWAALSVEAGAERIDVVHRHEVPRFERVSWRFVDPHVERTLTVPGYWRRLPKTEQDAIARRFWEVGRLTLEHWLTPRLDPARVRRSAGVHVVEAAPEDGDEAVELTLSDSRRLTVDFVVFATGYRACLSNVHYLQGLLDRVAINNGFPVLDEALRTSLAGLYITGFSATQDFGPFFGFVKAAPAAGTLIVRDLLAQAG